MTIGKFTYKHRENFYFVFRILVGILFLQHGAQKLFGAFGGINGSSVQIFSLFGLAGIIEFFGGLFIILGLFTRVVALVAGIELLVAFFKAHVPQGIIPIVNQGELALLYVATFLVLMAWGAGKWGLDNVLFKKKG